MFDGKMAGILSGAGGASCQLCMATHKELKDRDFIVQGYPINRNISDAIQLFGEVEDVDAFFWRHYFHWWRSLKVFFKRFQVHRVCSFFG